MNMIWLQLFSRRKGSRLFRRKGNKNCSYFISPFPDSIK
jgi:hypothetical protein